MNIPEEGQSVTIHSMAKGSKYLGGKKIKSVSLLGYKGKLRWKQTSDGLVVTYPKGVNLKTSAVIKVSYLKSATIIQYTIKGRFMSR